MRLPYKYEHWIKTKYDYLVWFRNLVRLTLWRHTNTNSRHDMRVCVVLGQKRKESFPSSVYVYILRITRTHTHTLISKSTESLYIQYVSTLLFDSWNWTKKYSNTRKSHLNFCIQFNRSGCFLSILCSVCRQFCVQRSACTYESMLCSSPDVTLATIWFYHTTTTEAMAVTLSMLSTAVVLWCDEEGKVQRTVAGVMPSDRNKKKNAVGVCVCVPDMPYV